MNARMVLAAALITALLPATAGADDLPTVETILANHAKAVGPDHDAHVDITTFNSTARSGTTTFVQRGKDYRITTITGTATTTSGSYQGENWFQNANGHTVIVEPDPGQATPDVLTRTVSHVESPIDAYVISTLNVRKSGTRDFYDPKTWLLVRREDVGAAGTAVTTFDSFKQFGDDTLPAHWTSHDERTGLDTEYTRTAYRTGDISDSDVAIPENRRTLVEFPPGVNRVRLPATFLENGHIAVRINAGGIGLDFLLDTGASVITIDPAAIAKLNLPIVARSVNRANAGKVDTGTVVIPEMRVGDLTMHDVVASAIPTGDNETGSIQAVGLLGFDFLCEMGISIDYVHKTVYAERYGAEKPPTSPKTAAIDARLGSQQPMVTVKVNNAIAERMLLDTGGAGPVLLFDYFNRRHPEALVDHHGIGNASPELRFHGVGGAIGTRPVAFENFALGPIVFKDFVGYVVTSNSYAAANEDGAIGPGFLRFFDVYLDYPNGTIYLTPNENARHG